MRPEAVREDEPVFVEISVEGARIRDLAAVSAPAIAALAELPHEH